MLPPVVTVDNMRRSDAETIAKRVSSAELMRRAAQGIFNAVKFTGRVAIVCGSGNNGGDGYALACILLQNGITPTVFRLSDRFSPDGLYYYRSAKGLGCEEGNINLPSPFEGFDIVVDCILGTGFKGEVKDDIRYAIEAINACSAFVISADINSGINGDTGVAQIAVNSDLTVSIGAYKTGMFLADAPYYIDKLVNTDIGIELIDEPYRLIDFEQLHLFEGYNSEVYTMEEFLSLTGSTPETLDAGGFVAEMTKAKRKTIVVKTEHTAVVGDLNYVYFAADYIHS
ncbi:NAD(P)H-hydrate epimerase [Ruminococcus sp.]|uniref:NAD(P)H-hydrate epimerase n=1 Tax=Ruminococcus sp. TaxID=41978 RepID=UPI002E7A86E9|nr:NAD(P)H-hydrate epimerase [Ruminococcus sp.]MEE1264131.1 NAD(P)H-hydrate epimerase [Ruminococcus sp.]